MKKATAAILSVLLVFSFLSACDSAASQTDSSLTTQQTESGGASAEAGGTPDNALGAEAEHDPVTDPQFTTRELLLGTSSSTSSYYAVGAGIADMLNAAGYGFTISATTSGGSVDNLNRIASGEAEMGIGIPDAVYEAASGTGDWTGKSVPVASLCAMWSNPLNVVVRANSGITSIADLAGKRVSTGAAGTGARTVPDVLLKAYGIDPDSLKWSNGTIAEQCGMLKDGQIDAILMTMGMGNSSLTDLAATTDVIWISADEDILKSIANESPFYCEVDMEADTYPGITDTVRCLGFKVNLYASTDRVSEDQAYLIVKTVFDDLDRLVSYHSAAKEVLLETAAQGLATELHPGAARYFREKGIIG